MKKIVSFTVLLISFLSASYAQVRKVVTPPVYDNVNKENLFNDQKTPKYMADHSLIDNSANASTQTNNSLTFSGNKNQDNSLFKIDHPVLPADQYNIRKVTFPKTNKFIN